MDCCPVLDAPAAAGVTAEEQWERVPLRRRHNVGG